MTKTTIALAAALLMGTATAALADSAKRHSTSTAKGAMKSTPVRGDQDRNMAMQHGCHPGKNLSFLMRSLP
jgi:hypothetical protein